MMYWWSRHGDFSPGIGILPHTGQVIQHYRQKQARYKKQKDLAIAAGVSERLVQDWETSMYIESLERRIVLAKLLKIPPALLGLDWRLVTYKDNTGTYTNPLEYIAELLEEDSFYTYEDILFMGNELLQKGGPQHVAGRLQRRLKRLRTVVDKIPAADKDAWQDLLVRYYVLTATYARHNMQLQEALGMLHDAVVLAKSLDDLETLSFTLYRRTRAYLDIGDHKAAKKDIAEVMQYLDSTQLNAPLKGNIYLTAVEIHMPNAKNNPDLERQIRQWFDKALAIAWKGNVEDDRFALKLTLSGIHHEKAKTLLQFYQFDPQASHSKEYMQEARREMNLAWSSLGPDFAEWRMYYLLTDARIYKAEQDVEASARTGLDALKVSRLLNSKKGELQVQALYQELSRSNEVNPYVDNLGIELGVL